MSVMVIGGGAAGMMAALTAAERGEQVLLLERQARLGRKLLATGNGRCNLTNMNMSLDHYHGENPDFCAYALGKFDVSQTLKFFYDHGLLTVSEPEGRVYPLSDSANSVLDVLRLHLEQMENVRLISGCEVLELRRKKGVFYGICADATYEANRVIVCAGGLAGGKLGGTDFGYKLLSSFGHTRTKLYPALVQMKTDTTLVRSLKGVRAQAAVCYAGEKRCGEIQFTEYGVSGPVIFELSRKVAAEGGNRMLFLDFLPNMERGEVCSLLMQRKAAMPKLKAEELLTGILHNRLGRTLVRSCSIGFEELCGEISDERLFTLTQAVKQMTLQVQGILGFEGAQVTAGGIRTADFDETTMESKLCPGLYAAGEVLDIDGDCGGYNLQWAWSSGHLAGCLGGKV